MEDDKYKPIENAGARYCKDCDQVIFIGSRLQIDAYYIGEDNNYHHHICPLVESEYQSEDLNPGYSGKNSLSKSCPSCGSEDVDISSTTHFRNQSTNHWVCGPCGNSF